MGTQCSEQDICNNNTSSHQILAMAFLKIAVLALLCAMAFSKPIAKEEVQDPGLIDGFGHVVGGVLGGAGALANGVIGGATHLAGGVFGGAHHVVQGGLHGLASALGDEEGKPQPAKEEVQDPGLIDGLGHVVGGGLRGAGAVTNGVLGGVGSLAGGVLGGA